jgi:hypothetical protein
VEVPGVDRNSPGARIVDQHADLLMVGFWLREGVIQDDVDQVGDGLVGVQLGDYDAVSVRLQNVRQAHHHDVVVIDQRGGDRSPGYGLHRTNLDSLRV